MKRIIERPLAFKRSGGYVITREALLALLKNGQVLQYGKVSVGARELRQLVNLMPYTDCMVKVGERLEIETVDRKQVKAGDSYRTAYVKPAKNWVVGQFEITKL